MTQLFLMICSPDGYPLSMTNDSLETKYELLLRSQCNFKDTNAKGSTLLSAADGLFFAWLRHNKLWFLMLAHRTDDYYQAAAVADLRRVAFQFTEKFNTDHFDATNKPTYKRYEFGDDYDAILEKELAAMRAKEAARTSTNRRPSAPIVHCTQPKKV